MDRICPKCRRDFACSGNCADRKEQRYEYKDACLCPECLESTLLDAVMSLFKSVNAYDTGVSLVYSANFSSELAQNVQELQRANTKLRKICNRTRRNETSAGSTSTTPSSPVRD